jgi:outer membrane protein, heavy metal efflux system
MSRTSDIFGILLLALAATAWGQEQVPAPGRVLTLEDATRMALANSPLLAQAEAKVEQARGQVTQAGFYPNPRYDGGNPHQLGGSQSLYNTGITQPVVTGGKIPLDVAIAQRALGMARYRLAQRQFELLSNVRRQFFLLVAAQERLETVKRLRTNSERSLNASRQRVAAGEAPETDVLLLRVQLSRIEVNVANLVTSIEADRRALASTIGLPDLAIARASGDLGLSLPSFERQQAEERLLIVNSALLAARTDIARNQFRRRRAEVAWIPDVECQGGYQYTVMPTRNQVVIGTYFDVPLWNRNQGNILATGADVRASQAQSTAVANDLLRQLSAAMGHYTAAQRRVETLEGQVLPDARRAFSLVLGGYQQGEFELVRLLNAERTLFEATLDYISAQQDRLTSGTDIAGLLQLEQFP